MYLSTACDFPGAAHLRALVDDGGGETAVHLAQTEELDDNSNNNDYQYQ
jgi:hypothetical protein